MKYCGTVSYNDLCCCKARMGAFQNTLDCNEKTGDRKYVWSRVNTPVELAYPMKRSERWSLLPALTVNGYLNYTIF